VILWKRTLKYLAEYKKTQFFLIILVFTIFLSFSGLAFAGYDFDLVLEGIDLGWNWETPSSPAL